MQGNTLVEDFYNVFGQIFKTIFYGIRGFRSFPIPILGTPWWCTTGYYSQKRIKNKALFAKVHKRQWHTLLERPSSTISSGSAFLFLFRPTVLGLTGDPLVGS